MKRREAMRVDLFEIMGGVYIKEPGPLEDALNSKIFDNKKSFPTIPAVVTYPRNFLRLIGNMISSLKPRLLMKHYNIPGWSPGVADLLNDTHPLLNKYVKEIDEILLKDTRGSTP